MDALEAHRRPGRGWTAYPSFGAIPHPDGVRFRVWAPLASRVDLVLDPGGTVHAMVETPGGIFEVLVPGLGAGAHYRYRLDEGPPLPDPASRSQPDGIHGSSMVVDPGAYRWGDAGWQPPRHRDLVFYELHVGTFTPEGTFAGARSRLAYLRDLGINAIELMPLGDFPGRWNWGYDPAAIFAPARAYGTPDDLRTLVDEAHRMGLAVFLDVIYNHFGPDGAYAPAVSPRFFSEAHRTPWGPAINFDGEGSEGVRAFFIENALHWLAEYHLDGLRLDATHAVADEGPLHVLAELAEAVHTLPGPRRYLFAEDARNLNRLILPADAGGYGLDGVWSDDYHHQMRRILTGDGDGYFADFTESTGDLATIVRRGWLYAGQHAGYFGGPRGTDPSGIPHRRFVHFIQNHDQVANRPGGARLTASTSWPAYRAAAALLLFAPEIPLLFMGQEWGALTPFRYFTDHTPELGRLVQEGRRRELARFAGVEGGVPDPQDPETFAASRLNWGEPTGEPHIRILTLHRDLLALRRELDGPFSVESPVEGGLVLQRGRHLLLVALVDAVTLPLAPGALLIWDSEEPRYAPDPAPPRVSDGAVAFPRAAAALARLPEG